LSFRHEALSQEETDSPRYDDLLWRVFDASNDLIAVLDEAGSRAARRRRFGALLLVLLALAIGAAVAWRLAGSYALIPAAAVLVAGVALWLTARPGKRGAGAGDEQ